MTQQKDTTTYLPSTMTEEQRLDYLVRKTVQDIQETNLTMAQVKLLYDAIVSKVEWRTCFSCGKLGVLMEGVVRHVNMDLSKPKGFLCRQCLIAEGSIKEKR